ncbi:MAG: hypothetical protein PF589_04395, partial [Gammaproteobacteria bacterium]|nr:hypothetical protein [Gammaproteobacteria bacterium]
MFGFRKHKKSDDKRDDKTVEKPVDESINKSIEKPVNSSVDTAAVVQTPAPIAEPARTDDAESAELTEKLAKTRRGFGDGLADFLLGK